MAQSDNHSTIASSTVIDQEVEFTKQIMRDSVMKFNLGKAQDRDKLFVPPEEPSRGLSSESLVSVSIMSILSLILVVMLSVLVCHLFRLKSKLIRGEPLDQDDFYPDDEDNEQVEAEEVELAEAKHEDLEKAAVELEQKLRLHAGLKRDRPLSSGCYVQCHSSSSDYDQMRILGLEPTSSHTVFQRKHSV